MIRRYLLELARRVVLARWEQEAIDSIERTEEGWVIFLRPGFANSRAGSHVFIAGTPRDVMAAFKSAVVPCGCAECESLQAQAWSMGAGGAR